VFLKSLIGLLRPERGKIVVDGANIIECSAKELYEIRKLFGVMLQNGALFGSMTLYDNTAFPLRELTKKDESELRNIAVEKLELVGPTGDENEFSGRDLWWNAQARAGRVERTTTRQRKKRRRLLVASLVAAAAVGQAAPAISPHAHAAPAPEVEYVYDVMVRRHYSFPNNDAIGYGHGICDKVTQGETYTQVMSDVKSDVTPNDEFAANYLISYAVNLLCPAEIWQLRNSAANYQPPPG
jgi:hypothetical protein